MPPKIIIYFRINLTKGMKDLYAKKYKTLLKVIKDLNKWKDILCSCITRFEIVKMSVPLKEIYRFNTISIKIPTVFFPEMEKWILKFIWNFKRPWIAKTTMKKNNKLWVIILSNFETYYEATLIKTTWGQAW